jgi:hypothetical protein
MELILIKVELLLIMNFQADYFKDDAKICT